VTSSGEAHVHDDQSIHAHLTRDIHRQVLCNPAVDEQPSVARRGCKYARRRNAGTQRRHQIARIHDDELARLQIRGNGPKRNRQPIEVLHLRDGNRRRAQHLLELLSLDEPARIGEPLGAHAERIAHEKVAIVLFAPEAELRARRTVLKRFLPIQRRDQPFDLRRRDAGGVEPADDRTHAGAGNGVDRDTHVLDDFQYADMSGTARPAAAQDEADARAVLLCFGRYRLTASQQQNHQENSLGNHGPRHTSRFSESLDGRFWNAIRLHSLRAAKLRPRTHDAIVTARRGHAILS
jgi:hypothetical protein